MKVFISWSGDKSRSLANVFYKWLPATIQAVKPYFSPDDIDKGARWASEIAQELETANIGLICLTRDNLEAPWLMFEAGALSKSIGKSWVVPLLFEIEPTDIKGPLSSFQASKFTKEEIHRLLEMINTQLNENALDGKVLDDVFEKWWPELEEKVINVLKHHVNKKSDDEIRSDRELLEEVLKHTRTIRLETELYNDGGHFLPNVRDEDPILDREIEFLDLSHRAIHSLKQDGISYIGQLVQLNENELLNVPNLGRRPMNEIKNTLLQYRLSLGQIIPDWEEPTYK